MPTHSAKNGPQFYAPDRETWREWLRCHHNTEKQVWLILYRKHSDQPTLSYEESVEEALCYGWIDSVANKRDEESYYLFFAVRKPRSPWSAINKKRIEKLMKEGRMTPAGLEKIEAAKKDGSWTMLDRIEAMEMPDDLQKALKSNKIASKNFNAFPPGVRKTIFQWIISAKRPETRQKRVDETVDLAAKNIRANQWRDNHPRRG